MIQGRNFIITSNAALFCGACVTEIKPGGNEWTENN